MKFRVNTATEGRISEHQVTNCEITLDGLLEELNNYYEIHVMGVQTKDRFFEIEVSELLGLIVIRRDLIFEWTEFSNKFSDNPQVLKVPDGIKSEYMPDFAELSKAIPENSIVKIGVL